MMSVAQVQGEVVLCCSVIILCVI